MNSFESMSINMGLLEIEQSDVQTAFAVPGPASLPETEVEDEPIAEQPEPNITEQSESSKVFEMAAIPLNPSELAYSCLLLPRFSDHYLTGDVTKDLAAWMKQICISYGWRLDAITIRPGYVQWIMTVPLTANPAKFMRIMCQQTSQKIFEDYPRFKRKNLSLEFWAPGFSVVPGSTPQSLEDINNFILQIRRQQGIF